MSNNKRNMMAPTSMNMMTKTNNVECCMCGDLGLSHLLFRCVVCHFRSQHRYCSNLYPKAESYKVCNWCLINKDNVDGDQHKNLNLPSLNNNSDNKKLKRANNHSPNGPGPKCLRPTSPIKKPAIRSPPVQSKSPSGRKAITASNSARARDHQEEFKIGSSSSSKTNKTKSTSSVNAKMAKKNNIDNNNKKLENVNVSKKSESGREANGGGPIPVIKHVFRNKVRRYKLLAEVSC